MKLSQLRNVFLVFGSLKFASYWLFSLTSRVKDLVAQLSDPGRSQKPAHLSDPGNLGSLIFAGLAELRDPEFLGRLTLLVFGMLFFPETSPETRDLSPEIRNLRSGEGQNPEI